MMFGGKRRIHVATERMFAMDAAQSRRGRHGRTSVPTTFLGVEPIDSDQHDPDQLAAGAGQILDR